ncbi:MAG: LamG-like jellyroll fold domain-containing protein [Bacteroidota bacterium]
MKTMKTLILTGLLLMAGNIIAQNFALYFNGLNNKVGVYDNAALNPASSFTVEAWINAAGWAGSIWAGNIVSKQGTSPDRGYGLTAGENGRVEFTVAMNNAWFSVNTPQLLGLNSWYHLAGVFDGTSLKIYVNGLLQNSAPVSGTFSPSTGVVMNFGENPTFTGRYFNGDVDEVRIWNVARTETEIFQNMAITLTGSEPGLAGYWTMNEGMGNVTNDKTSNGNNGTLVNMTAANWVQGFVPPGLDAGVTGIISPSRIGSGFTANETVTVIVKNFSTENITDIPVSFSIEGGTPVSGVINGVLPPFSSVEYSFPNPVNLSGYTSVQMKAYTSVPGDNNPNNDTIAENITQTLDYYIFYKQRHNFGGYGQTHIAPVYMPANLSAYSHIYLYADLECPASGCDPWDQAAQVYITKDSVTYEIARYITPFGVACGGWKWDITDFRGVLTGKVDFMSYVQVWGASGWLVSVRLVLEEGAPDYPYSTITPLWDENNWVYGDPDISYIFPEKNVFIYPETEKAKIRMTSTGHGQGNTLNAAEFADFTHHILINGAPTFEQHLWKSDCNQNSCSPQNGTYLYSRAGWCPGQEIQPWEWDMAGYYTPGENLTVKYVLADYLNLLNSGYNGSSHTEPFIRTHAYLVQFSTDPYLSAGPGLTIEESGLTIYPNPASDHVIISGQSDIREVELLSFTGQVILREQVKKKFHKLNISSLPAGIYFIRVFTENGTSCRKLIVQ